MLMRYHPLDIDYDGWIGLDDKRKSKIGEKYLKRNREYIDHHRGDSFWVMIGSRSGVVLARGEREDFPGAGEKERISREYGEFGMVFTGPIRHDLDLKLQMKKKFTFSRLFRKEKG